MVQTTLLSRNKFIDKFKIVYYHLIKSTIYFSHDQENLERLLTFFQPIFSTFSHTHKKKIKTLI